MSLSATHNSERIAGTSGPDFLWGAGGDDRISGGLGDDVIFEGYDVWGGATNGTFTNGVHYDFGIGSDFIDGGPGIDVVSYWQTSAALLVDAAAGTVTKGNEVDTLVGIEGIILSDGNDRVINPLNQMAFLGGPGRDTAILHDAAFVVTVNLVTGDAEIGNEILFGLLEFEIIEGSQTRANVLIGAATHDRLVGGDADDSIDGAGGNDRLIGGLGDDTIEGGDGANWIDGGAGGDVITAGEGRNYVLAGNGNDEVTLASRKSTVYGGIGNDVITLANFSGEAKKDDSNLYGEEGRDRIVGDGRANLFGGDGDDRLTNGTLLDGGRGNDTISNANTALGGTGNDTIEGAKVARGGSGDDQIRGKGEFYGEGGRDTILSQGGVVYGGRGDDRISAQSTKLVDGGSGADDISTNAETAHIVRAGKGSDSVSVSGINRNGPRVEIDGGRGEDTLIVRGELSISIGEDDVLTKKRVVVTGFEKFEFEGKDDDVLLLKNGLTFALDSGEDRISILANDSYVDLDSDDDRAVIGGARNIVNGGFGDDRYVVLAEAGRGIQIDDVRGDDLFKLFGQAHVLAGSDNDRAEIHHRAEVHLGFGEDSFEVYSGAAFVKVFGDDGNDTGIIRGHASQVDLGAGDDLLELALRDPGTVRITTGAGADTLRFATKRQMKVEVNDLSAEDRVEMDRSLAEWEITELEGNLILKGTASIAGPEGGTNQRITFFDLTEAELAAVYVEI